MCVCGHATLWAETGREGGSSESTQFEKARGKGSNDAGNGAPEFTSAAAGFVLISGAESL